MPSGDNLLHNKDAIAMTEKICPKCGESLIYNEKTGLFKCKNGRCGNVCTLAALRKRKVGNYRQVVRKRIIK